MEELDREQPTAKSPLRLSKRSERTGKSPISEMMSHALANPDLISLAAGFVDYETLPVGEVREAVEGLLADEVRAREALQYGTTMGLGTLRGKLAARLATLDGHAVGTRGYTPDNMLCGTGSQQLLYLLAEVLLDPGDIVILGHPSYFVFMDALKASGVSCRSVPLDDDGMRTDLLRELLGRIDAEGALRRVKMVYVVSYFQNPTGISLSAKRRRDLLDVVREFAGRHRIHIVEDAAYRELRYDGDDVPSIRSFDETGETVIHLGTFSKPFSPGLRTGYGLFPRELAARVECLKGAHDFGSSNFAQHLIDIILERGLYDLHVARLREHYRMKRDVIVGTLDREMPKGVRRTRPHGGLYVWLTLPEDVRTGPDSPLFKKSLERGVVYVPGEFCFAACPGRPIPTNCMRLSFGVGTPDRIAEGVKRLVEALRECTGRRGRSRMLRRERTT